MFGGNKQPGLKDAEITRSSAAQSEFNPAMVSQLNKVVRHAEDIQKDAEAESKPDNQNRKMTVGPGVQLKGEITDCDTVVVEGHVEGTAKSRLVEITETGSFRGDIEVRTANVSGCFDGNLNVIERLTIRSTGRVSGKIQYNTIEIEPGGRISGDVKTEEEAKDNSPVDKDVNKPDSMVV